MSANIKHFANEDDTIIFASVDKVSLEIIMGVLQETEEGSRQLVNREKSCLYMFSKTAQALVNEVEKITGFERGPFLSNT